MGKILFTTVLLAFLIGLFAWYFSTQKPQESTNQDRITPTSTSIGSIPVEDEEVEKLKLGGSSYTDEQGVFTVLYTNDYAVDQINNGEFVRFYKKGPTQTGQTEIYDGVIVHFQSVDLGDKSLKEWVDEQIINSTSDGTSQLTSEKKKISINNYPGYAYTMRGLGESSYYVFQKNENSRYAVSVTTLVADPGNMGFQKEVNAMLSETELFK